MTRSLWKPQSESSYNPGAMTFLTDYGQSVSIRDRATGKIIETGRNTGASNGYGSTNRFSKPGSAYNNVDVVNERGEIIARIDNGGQRYEIKGGGDSSSSFTPGQSPIGSLSDAQQFVASPISLDYSGLQYPTIEAAVSPNREISTKDVLGMASEALPYGKKVYQDSLELMRSMYPEIANFSKKEISSANRFNQKELDTAYTRFPQIEAGINDNFERAKTFKAGGVPDSVLNRALDTSIRSRGSNLSRYSGVGARSGFAGRTNELISAEEALKLMDTGTELEKLAMAQAENLISKPQKFEAKPEEYLENFRKENTLTSTDILDEMSQNRELNSQIDENNANRRQQTDQFNATNTYTAIKDRLDMEVFNQGEAQKAEQQALDYFLSSMDREYMRSLELEDRAYEEEILRSRMNDIESRDDINSLVSFLGLLNGSDSKGQPNPIFSNGGIFSREGAFGNLINWGRELFGGSGASSFSFSDLVTKPSFNTDIGNFVGSNDSSFILGSDIFNTTDPSLELSSSTYDFYGS